MVEYVKEPPRNGELSSQRCDMKKTNSYEKKYFVANKEDSSAAEGQLNDQQK